MDWTGFDCCQSFSEVASLYKGTLLSGSESQVLSLVMIGDRMRDLK